MLFLYFRFDWRLTFVNLQKVENHKNIIGADEQGKIWIPNLIFDNSVEDIEVSNDPFSSLIVNYTGISKPILNNNLHEDKLYDGADNCIIYSREYKMKLLCEFEQQNFPFDSQTCNIKVKNHFNTLATALLKSILWN
jgi:hypothetical protein